MGINIDKISNTDIFKTAQLFSPSLHTERTLALIKPTAVSKGYAQNIINEIKENEFTIISQKLLLLTIEGAQDFYKEHEGKPFYDELVSFMSSGPIYAFILEKSDAIKSWRTLLGPTNTFTAKQTASQSLRARYGTDQTDNACHGSDSAVSSQREIDFFFPEINKEKSLSFASNENFNRYRFGKSMTDLFSSLDEKERSKCLKILGI